MPPVRENLINNGGRRSMAHNTILNLLGQLIPMLIGLFSIPLLIRHIGMARFGLLSLIWIVIGYFAFFDLGLGRAIIKLVAEKIGDRQEEEIPKIFWNALLIMTGMSVIGSIIVFLITPFLVTSVFKIPAELQTEAIDAFYVLSFSLILVTVTAGFRGILEARQRFDFANLLQICLGASTFVGPLVVSFWTSNLYLLVVFLLVVRLFILIAHMWFVFLLYPEIRNPAKIEKATMRRLFAFATWMTVSNVISPIMVYFDRFVLSAIVPMAQLAFYTTPYEIVNRLLVVPAAIVRTIFPRFAYLGVEKSRIVEVLFLQCVKAVAFILFPTVLFIVYFGDEALRLWLGADFARESTTVLRILAIGILLNGVALIPMTLLQSAERADLTAKTHMLEFPFYLPAVWFMASRFGLLGAAIAWTSRVTIDMFLLFAACRWVVPSLGRELIRLLPLLLLFMLFLIPPFFHIPLADRAVIFAILLPTFIFVFWSVVIGLEERLVFLSRLKIRTGRAGGHAVATRLTSPVRKGRAWAVVVSYNPDDGFARNLYSYADQVDKVIVVDNGSSPDRQAVLDGIKHPNIEIHRNHSNLGIAAALNTGVRKAYESGCEWVITFDQDSHVGADYVEKLLGVLEQSSRSEEIAMIAPSYVDEVSGRTYRASGRSDHPWVETQSGFTSGTMVRLAAVQKVGLFEEQLFIDYVDHEFALRLLSHGYLLIEARDVHCIHNLGKMRQHVLVSKQFSSTHHNPVRRYYMTRNRLVVYRRFFLIEPLWVVRDMWSFAKELLKIALVEDQKWAKIKAVLRGFMHGLNFKLVPGSFATTPVSETLRVGIVLATYEPPMAFLREQLNSIAAQTDKNWFCLISDDGSSAQSSTAIEAMAQEILGSRFQFRKNAGRAGVVGNFADGLAALPPDCALVCLCDQDDIWSPNKILILRAELQKPGVALVHSDLRLVDSAGRETHPSCWGYEGRDICHPDPATLVLRNVVTGCAMMFRREVLEFCLPFPEVAKSKPAFYHDVWIALGASLFGTIKAVPQTLVSYRQHGANAVGAEKAAASMPAGISARSSWVIGKTEDIWKTRAVLEEEFALRLKQWSARHADEVHVAPHVFTVAWDFGFFPALMGLKVALRSPRSFKVALAIAAGKFFSDCGRLACAIGIRHADSERAP